MLTYLFFTTLLLRLITIEIRVEYTLYLPFGFAAQSVVATSAVWSRQNKVGLEIVG